MVILVSSRFIVSGSSAHQIVLLKNPVGHWDIVAMARLSSTVRFTAKSSENGDSGLRLPTDYGPIRDCGISAAAGRSFSLVPDVFELFIMCFLFSMIEPDMIPTIKVYPLPFPSHQCRYA